MNDYRMIRVHLKCFCWEYAEQTLEPWPLWFDIVVDKTNKPVCKGEGYFFGGHKYHTDKGKELSPMVPVLLHYEKDGEICRVEKYIRLLNDRLEPCSYSDCVRIDRYTIENFLNRRIEKTKYDDIKINSSNPSDKKKIRDMIEEKCPTAIVLKDHDDGGSLINKCRSYYNIFRFGIIDCEY